MARVAWQLESPHTLSSAPWLANSGVTQIGGRVVNIAGSGSCFDPSLQSLSQQRARGASAASRNVQDEMDNTAAKVTRGMGNKHTAGDSVNRCCQQFCYGRKFFHHCHLSALPMHWLIDKGVYFRLAYGCLPNTLGLEGRTSALELSG